VTRGQKAVLIEDLISTGKSSILAAKRLEEAGVKVDSIISIFSYNFIEAQENFKIQNLSTYSLSNFEDLAKVAYDNKVLNMEALNQVLDWKKGVKFP
jgi:orotate phosphoribosyltransferase